MVNKCVKRLEVIQRETRASGPKLPPDPQHQRQRYALGLSLGASSTALLHILHEHLRHQRRRGGRTTRWDVIAVHVVDYGHDHDAAAAAARTEAVLQRYRARFPDIEIRTVGLQGSSSAASTEGAGSGARQQHWANLLPTATSRADVRRLLTRRALLASAARLGCDALLLGHSTTALAELTLAETAKGRGFALPWLVNDGVFPLPSSSYSEEEVDMRSLLGLGDGGATKDENAGEDDGAAAHAPAPDGQSTPAPPQKQQQQSSIPVYHPLREHFRKELLVYTDLTTPPLTALLPPQTPGRGDGAAVVVSHRDLSIDDVMARYFGEVEASYPSVVANGVRTTGKLGRRGGGPGGHDGGGEAGAGCGLCGVPLDRTGDERRWGEIGEDEDETAARIGEALCYGCERSTRR